MVRVLEFFVAAYNYAVPFVLVLSVEIWVLAIVYGGRTHNKWLTVVILVALIGIAGTLSYAVNNVQV